jgi:Uricase
MSLIEGRGEAAVGVLASAKYGKDKVRVFRVVRDATSKVHDVVEYNVTLLVEGAIKTRCGSRCIIDRCMCFVKPCWQ